MTHSFMKKKLENDQTIAIAGLWHLGSVYASSFAKQGYKAWGFDKSKKVVKNLNSASAPLFEPDLEKIIKKSVNKNLFFTSDPKKAFEKRKYIFLTVDTKIGRKDDVSLMEVEDYFKEIIKYADANAVIVISSQLPVGTCRYFDSLLKQSNKKISILYVPENIRLGEAINSFLKPDRMIVGTIDEEVALQFIEDFPFFNCPVFIMSWESAEISKHALNSYLATMISFSSEISDFCEAIGADYNDVVKSLKSDGRVSNSAPIKPGLGFSGGTLGRDLKILIKKSREMGINIPMLQGVYKTNSKRIKALVSKIERNELELSNKVIGILGLTYKPNTSTLRRSMSLELAKILSKKGNKIKGFDPMIKKSISGYSFLIVETEMEKFFNELDIIILMTDCEEFNQISAHEISILVNSKTIYDTKNVLDKDEFMKEGFSFYSIGTKR